MLSTWWTTAGRRSRSSLRSSRRTRNGTNGIGPSVELVLGNGNGRHDDADGPQQSLFSWAEFLAENR